MSKSVPRVRPTWAACVQKAFKHFEEHPSFNLGRFLADLAQQSNSYIAWASKQTTARVNKSLKEKRKNMEWTL